jgi:hypothetical protein
VVFVSIEYIERRRRQKRKKQYQKNPPKTESAVLACRLSYLHHPLPGHGDAPIIRGIVDHEQLQ